MLLLISHLLNILSPEISQMSRNSKQTPKMPGYSQPQVSNRSCYHFTLGGDGQGQRPPMEGDRALRQRYQIATQGEGRMTNGNTADASGRKKLPRSGGSRSGGY